MANQISGNRSRDKHVERFYTGLDSAMDFPLPIRSVTSTVDYFTPLHVDTSMDYCLDMEKFPDINTSLHHYEPTLLITCDSHLPTDLCDMDLTALSPDGDLSLDGIHIQDLIDSLDCEDYDMEGISAGLPIPDVTNDHGVPIPSLNSQEWLPVLSLKPEQMINSPEESEETELLQNSIHRNAADLAMYLGSEDEAVICSAHAKMLCGTNVQGFLVENKLWDKCVHYDFDVQALQTQFSTSGHFSEFNRMDSGKYPLRSRFVDSYNTYVPHHQHDNRLTPFSSELGELTPTSHLWSAVKDNPCVHRHVREC